MRQAKPLVLEMQRKTDFLTCLTSKTFFDFNLTTECTAQEAATDTQSSFAIRGEMRKNIISRVRD